MGKNILLILLVAAAILLTAQLYLSKDSEQDGVENRVIRLEKIPATNIFKTSWNEQWIWVVPRPQNLQRKLHSQGSIPESLSGPKNVFRSLMPDYFIFATQVSEDGKSKLETAPGGLVLCGEFAMPKHIGSEEPENALVACKGSESGDAAAESVYYFDAVGQAIPDQPADSSQKQLVLKPLEVPPQYINKQRHLVIGQKKD